MGTIYENLQDYWQKLTEVYPENKLLCLYRYGSSDKDFGYEAIYIPSLQELCCSKPKTQVVNCGFAAEVKLINIQTLFVDSYLVKAETVSDMLSTPYYIANPKYKKAFDACFRGEFAERMTQELYPPRMYYQALASLNDAPSQKTKEILESVITTYEPYNLKNKPMSAYKFWIPFQKFVCAIVKLAHNTSNEKDELQEEFPMPKLTENEKKAVNAIINKISGLEGNFSIVKLAQETGLSRPVFSGALNKLQADDFIVTANQGVKGTFIRFCHLGFFNEIQKIKAD